MPLHRWSECCVRPVGLPNLDVDQKAQELVVGDESTYFGRRLNSTRSPISGTPCGKYRAMNRLDESTFKLAAWEAGGDPLPRRTLQVFVHDGHGRYRARFFPAPRRPSLVPAEAPAEAPASPAS